MSQSVLIREVLVDIIYNTIVERIDSRKLAGLCDHVERYPQYSTGVMAGASNLISAGKMVAQQNTVMLTLIGIPVLH